MDTASTAREGADIPVTVRAASGQSRDDAWVRRQQLPWRQRLAEAGRFAAIGLVGGALLLVLFGVAALRLRHADVLAAAGGVCPRCGKTGSFFVGLGRRRFQLPTSASCEACSVDLTLER